MTASLKFHTRTRRANPEAALQKAVLQHLNLTGVPGLLWFHPANEGKRSLVNGFYLKSLGMLPGVADLVLVHEGRTYFLEIKAAGGRLSDAQREFAGRATAAGARWAVAYSIDAAITILRDWQLIRRAVRAA